MNKFSVIVFFALCTFAGTNAFAQGKRLTQLPAAAEAAARTARQAASSAVKVSAGPRLKPAQPLPAPTVSPRVSAFTTKYQRPLVGIQKTVGISTRQAWENLKGLGAVYTPKNPRPKLQEEQAFTTPDLTAFTVSRAEVEAAPEFPFQNQRQLIYRGMALEPDGNAIRNILENGLRTQDVGREANTLLLSMAGPNARHAAVRQPQVNLTDNPSSAVMWAGKRWNKGQLIVVTVVVSPRTGSIITSGDIPADKIYAQTALLKIDGKPVWCKLELAEEGLRVTPYQTSPAAE